MAKIYQFPTQRQKRLGLADLFSPEEVNTYKKYFTDSDDWQQSGKDQAIYQGYPWMTPCEPVRGDMVWYVNEKLGFGTWVINKSSANTVENTDLVWGWSPFVRKSPAPIHEPLNLTQKEMRHHIVWIVDEEEYGQYGLVTNKGELWVPHPRPVHWRDHNAAYSNL
ncbi:hypothetical protein SAMN04487897_109148 [Paenibacillus sp. yr247]|uniref:hypothetical protein n=1 Tax=Paenibacillus sp. yr247 TaxID=1761880 RepID=UPI000891921E|nr:hypothetical protein [Paenibacillus sp. yr247]SDO18767.1 hypothetical protein SAMN04487897_109148 [Paenibacillus sp. yr247]